MLKNIYIEDCADAIKSELYRQYKRMYWNGCIDGVSIVKKEFERRRGEKANYSIDELLDILEEQEGIYKDLINSTLKNGDMP